MNYHNILKKKFIIVIRDKMCENGKRDYNNGRIYCIRNSIDKDLYIGSTCQSLSKRFQKHKDASKSYKKDRKLYTKINAFGIDKFYIELIEQYPCENVEQLRQREGELIRKWKPVLNKIIAGRTKDELDKTRVECDCGGSYLLSHKGEHLQSKKHLQGIGKYNEEEYKQSKRYKQIKSQYETTKDTLDEDKMREYKKKSYEKHKDEYSKNSKERMICECGADICKGSYLRHCKTKTHKNFLNNNIDNVRFQEEKQQ